MPILKSLPRLAALVLFIPAICLAQSAPAGWTKLENCRISSGEYMDGDSFHVTHNGKNHIFRLYFVDCPETDASFPKRIADQMEDFGLATEQSVIKAGELATDFTKKMLSAPFTVLTKWEDARGNSRQKRYYAVIFVGPKNLAEELARAGWARAYGMPADYPSADRSKWFRDSLRRHQANAIRRKIGAFAGTTRVLAEGEIAVPEREYVDLESEVGGTILDEGINDIAPVSGLE